MRVFKGIDKYVKVGSTCLTTGTFDGVHVGHRKIINLLNEYAQAENRRSVILTFHPHPRKVIFPDDHGLELLTTMEEKLDLFEKAGLDDVVIHPFSKDFSRYNSIEYVRDLLVNSLSMKHMIIGYDHRFGRNREGDIHQLKELAPMYDFTVTEISAQEVDEVNVSSTKIRTALSLGQVELAHSFLGYPYKFMGVVVRGKQRGRTIGFPTANVKVVDDTKLVPGNGVYAVNVKFRDTTFRGMMNIGTNPTFNDNLLKTIEVHLFAFDADIYDETLEIELLKFLRQEQRFSSTLELHSQLQLDKQHALAI